MQAKTDIWQRLLELADHFGSIPKLAKATGLGYTTLKGAIDTRRRITSETAAIIIRKTGASADWLITGAGEMFPPNVTRSGNGSLSLPVLACASAASRDGVCRITEDQERYSRRIPLPADAHMIAVHGDSMFPVAEDGQFVIVTDEAAKSGDLAVVETKDGEIIFKRITIRKSEVICVSINRQREYEPIVKKLSEIRKMRKVWGTKF